MCVTAFMSTLLGAPKADPLQPGQEVQELQVLLFYTHKPQKQHLASQTEVTKYFILI